MPPLTFHRKAATKCCRFHIIITSLSVPYSSNWNCYSKLCELCALEQVSSAEDLQAEFHNINMFSVGLGCCQPVVFLANENTEDNHKKQLFFFFPQMCIFTYILLVSNAKKDCTKDIIEVTRYI